MAGKHRAGFTRAQIGLAALGAAILGGALALGGGSAASAATSEKLVLPAGASVQSDTGAITLGVKFTPKVAGTVTGVEFIRSSTANTAHQVQLWDTTGGAKLATASTPSTGTGAIDGTFATPVKVTAGHTYVASYYAATGHYDSAQPGNAGGTTDLAVPANAGVFRYGNTVAYPNSSYGNDYQVTPLFTPTTTSTNQAPTASFTSSVSGLGVAVDASASTDPDGTIASYAWNFGDGATGTGKTASHTYAAAGTYTVTLTVTDNGGATGTTTRSVTVVPTPVNQAPTASFTSSVSGLAVAVDGSGSTDPDGTIASYAWNFGDGSAAGSGATASHTYAAAGTYTVTLTVTDNGGATGSTSHAVSVTAPPPPTGQFTVSSTGRIIDPAGKDFVPVGVNADGPDWVWPDPTIGMSPSMIPWHFNTLRLNTCFTGGCVGAPDETANNNLDGIVNEYTAKHDVIIIAQHQYGSSGGGGLSQAHIDELVSWWKTTAAKYKDNPYVWFNLINEPDNGVDANDLTFWDNVSRQLATAVRSVAPSSIIVADGSSDGQDKGGWGCEPNATVNGVDWGGSAVINKGPAFAHDFGNVVFSTHFYGEWGGNEQYGCGTPQWDTTMGNYVDKVHSLGLALIAGETGSRVNKADEPFYEGGSWNATHVVYDVLPGKGVGVLPWHGAVGSPFDLNSPDTSWFNYGEAGVGLTWGGQDLLNYAKQINP